MLTSPTQPTGTMLDRAAREHQHPCWKFCEIALLGSKSPGPQRARPGLAGGGEKAAVGQPEGLGRGRGLRSRRKELRKRKGFPEHTWPLGVLRKGLLLLVLDLGTRNTAHPAGLPEPARATSSRSLLRSRAEADRMLHLGNSLQTLSVGQQDP